MHAGLATSVKLQHVSNSGLKSWIFSYALSNCPIIGNLHVPIDSYMVMGKHILQVVPSLYSYVAPVWSNSTNLKPTIIIFLCAYKN